MQVAPGSATQVTAGVLIAFAMVLLVVRLRCVIAAPALIMRTSDPAGWRTSAVDHTLATQ